MSYPRRISIVNLVSRQESALVQAGWRNDTSIVSFTWMPKIRSAEGRGSNSRTLGIRAIMEPETHNDEDPQKNELTRSLLCATSRRHLRIYGQIQRVLFREFVIQFFPETQRLGQRTAFFFDCLQLRSRRPLVG